MTAQENNSRRRTGLLTLGACLLLAGLFCLRIPLVRDRYFDPDELQHVQIAFLISQGWVPHQDFFEHHNHLLHYILIPLIQGSNPAFTIFAGRVLMLAVTAAAAALTYLLGRIVAGHLTGLLAAIGLLSNYIYCVKATEIRPSNLAVMWLLLAVIIFQAALRGGRRLHLWFLGGFGSALCIISTQKAIFALAGMAAGLAAHWTRSLTAGSGRARMVFRQAAATAGGILLGISLYLIHFIHSGSLRGMLRETILANLSWKYRFSPMIVLEQLALLNPVFVFWSGVGLVWTGVILCRKPNRLPAASLSYFALLGGIAGLLIIPVPYAQYFVLLIPLAYVMAAMTAVSFLGFLWRSDPKTRSLAGAAVLLPIILPVYVRYGANYSYEWPLENTFFWICFLSAALLLAYLSLFLAPAGIGKRLASLALLAAIIVRPVNLIVNSYRYTNHDYLDLIKTVHRNTAADDRVFDAWTVLGLFRFPVYYYNFLHNEIFLLLDREERGPELLRALESHPPRVFIREDGWVKLPAEIGDFVDANYSLISETVLAGVPIQLYRLKDQSAD